MCLAAAVYAEQLLPKGYGCPLWIPEPDMAEGEIRIGDVGYINEGSFCTLFNAILPATHPANRSRNGVPGGFVPLEFNQTLVRTVDGYLPDALVCSQTVRRISIAAQAGVSSLFAPVVAQPETRLSFECACNKGALLVVNGGGAIREFLRPNQTFPEYMLAHHDSWCEFAREKGHAVDPEELVMVRSTVKASGWAVAAFMDETRYQSLELEAQGGIIGSTGVSLSLSLSSSISVDHRSGPSRITTPLVASSENDINVPPPRDQCLFLCRYKILRRKWLWQNRKIKAAGYRDDDPSSESGSEAGGIGIEWNSGGGDEDVIQDDCIRIKASDPLDILLKYILQNSECDIAIASDEDIQYLQTIGTITLTIGHNLAEQLDASRPQIQISANGVAYLATLADDWPSSHNDPLILSRPQSASNDNLMHLEIATGDSHDYNDLNPASPESMSSSAPPPQLRHVPQMRNYQMDNRFIHESAVYFRTNGAPGICLSKAIQGKFNGLEDPDRQIIELPGQTITYILEWPGYATVQRSMNGHREHQPQSRSRIAKQIAIIVAEFISEQSGALPTIPNWRVGHDFIALEDVYLVEVKRIGEATWVVELAVSSGFTHTPDVSHPYLDSLSSSPPIESGTSTDRAAVHVRDLHHQSAARPFGAKSPRSIDTGKQMMSRYASAGAQPKM